MEKWRSVGWIRIGPGVCASQSPGSLDLSGRREPVTLAGSGGVSADRKGTGSMITPEEAADRLGQAESAGHISPSALENIRRWLTEAPFAKYRPRLLEDIDAGPVGRARRGLLRRARIRHGRPPRQDVPGGHQRPERADDGRERPRPGRLRDGAEGRGLAADLRHRPRHAAPFRRVRRALCLRSSRPPVSRSSCSRISAPPRCSPSPSGISTATPGS